MDHPGDDTAESMLLMAGAIANDGVAQDFRMIEGRQPRTHGEKLYLELGLRGIRGEAADGFPSVRLLALPLFRTLREQGVSLNDAMVQTLLYLIKVVPDTNILFRGGLTNWHWAQEQAEQALSSGGILTEGGYARLVAMDQAFSERNISPGGCADLLAVTAFADAWERKQSKARGDGVIC